MRSGLLRIDASNKRRRGARCDLVGRRVHWLAVRSTNVSCFAPSSTLYETEKIFIPSSCCIKTVVSKYYSPDNQLRCLDNKLNLRMALRHDGMNKHDQHRRVALSALSLFVRHLLKSTTCLIAKDWPRPRVSPQINTQNGKYGGGVGHR